MILMAWLDQRIAEGDGRLEHDDPGGPDVRAGIDLFAHRLLVGHVAERSQLRAFVRTLGARRASRRTNAIATDK
jgi:hypothetical protein